MPFDKENIKALAWDLDNTLYRYTEILIEACNHSIARAAVKQNLPLTHEEAVEIGWESYTKYGSSGRVFVERYNICRESIHFDFHKTIDETIIETCSETISLFESLGLKHFLITHASRDWAIRTTRHLGLSRWLNEENCIGLEDTGFQMKSESRAPFERALDYLGLPAGEVLMVEDTADNLKVPHEMGMGTVLVHHGQKPESMPDYIDRDFDNAPALLRWLQEK